jgi:HD-GYP domain-containing protein (c-di-GMP phosphodiesterase class II)/predicted metal-dependent hydrolase
MHPSEASIATIASLLPFPNASNVSDRLAQLAIRLRDAPMTQEGRALFEMAADALSELPDEPVSADRLRCLLFISRYRYFCGDSYASLAPAEQAVALAERLKDTVLRATALKVLGVVHMETGNYPGAVSAFTAALESAQEARAPVQEVEILSNLGLAHQYAGHYSEAVPCYERAVEVAEAADGPALGRAIALSNIALACLHLRDFPRGLTAAERSIEALEAPSDAHERAVRAMAESYYARLLLEVRNLSSARERAKLARLYATGTNELTELVADMTQGLVETHDATSRDIGLSRLQLAVHRSRKGAAGALRDALAMIVRGYEAAGQPNSALVYLHEVVQLNRDSRVRNVLQHHHRHLDKVTRDLDLQAQVAIDEQHQELRFKRLSMDVLRECMQVLEKNTVAAELHDDDTGEHCYRVGALAKELALKKGMDPEMCTLIDLSARLHDIGKLRVPDSILLKPGRFTPDEREIMQKHCEHGWELIGEGGLAQLFVAQEIALNHHERWDGNGYPNRRQGNMIPLAARVTALADVYDALTHRRCYKEAWSVDDSLREIGSLRGKHFDPELTDLFLELIPQLQAKHGDLDVYLGAEARKNDFIADRERVARELKSDLGTFDVRR